jgi:hypothetical protein
VRLHELEVGEAREAVAPPEHQADGELKREDGEQRPPAGQDGDERKQPDGRLVEPRSTPVDDVEVPVRVGRAYSLHFVKLTGWGKRRSSQSLSSFEGVERDQIDDLNTGFVEELLADYREP